MADGHVWLISKLSLWAGTPTLWSWDVFCAKAYKSQQDGKTQQKWANTVCDTRPSFTSCVFFVHALSLSLALFSNRMARHCHRLWLARVAWWA
eukprot:2040520-Amphidinium_carterae.1